jgi:hypothetical protein
MFNFRLLRVAREGHERAVQARMRRENARMTRENARAAVREQPMARARTQTPPIMARGHDEPRAAAPRIERATPHMTQPNAARNRQQTARARHDMRTWRVERRKRTRHLIELGGLVVKARIVELTGDDRATILSALIWIADKLQSDQDKQARELWAARGKQAFDADPATRKGADRTAPAVRR